MRTKQTKNISRHCHPQLSDKGVKELCINWIEGKLFLSLLVQEGKR